MRTFGKEPAKAARLERMKKSPNYQDGKFQNIHPTSMSKEGGSTWQTAWEFFTTPKPVDIKPSKPIVPIKTDLVQLPDETPTLVWFGHSSYLIKYKGQNILVDPVFSGHAAPFSFAVNSFEGTDLYQVEDMPQIDLLILTHDHYDHIDFETVLKLKQKVKHILCPLGVGEHLEYWKFKPTEFTEVDWWEEYCFSNSIKLTATPARHFSGRNLSRFKTLWASYALELDQWKIFIGGDSGYDDQFKKIGEEFKSFDLALVECGQYGKNWPYIHMFPEQTAQAAKDLNTKALMPVHWGKFILSTHGWTESIKRVTVKANELGVKLCTPQIGEPIYLGTELPKTKWWEKFE